MGLHQLTSVGGEFWIDNNDMLTDLFPLNNLTFVGEYLYIINNAMLTSLSGLENIDLSSIDELGIYDNPMLSECDAQSICDYLVSPNGTIDIHDNASGCNSQQEVEEACASVSVNDYKSVNSFTISPNPCSSFANLRFMISDIGYVILDLFEISGVRIKQLLNETKTSGSHEMEIDMRDVPNGIYFCILKTNNGIQMRKIIKL